MKNFLESIELSLGTKNWYAALAVALTVPDICGALSNPKEGVGQRYKKWCHKYLVPRYTHNLPGGEMVFLSADDTYALRCAYLHAGADAINSRGAADVLDRIGFSSGGPHCNRMNVNGVNLLNLTVPGFCEDMISGAEQWLADMNIDANVQSRLNEFVVVHTSDYEIVPGVRIGVS